LIGHGVSVPAGVNECPNGRRPMKATATLAALLALLLAGVMRSPADAARPRLRAGAFARDVTPTTFPISVNGNMTDKKATAAHDPLHARCLVLDDGKTKIALVVVDSCMIPRGIHDAAKALAEKKTGIPAANILTSATHTHTAPTVIGIFQSDPDAGYVRQLPVMIAEGIEKAHARLVPAEAGWGALFAHGLGIPPSAITPIRPLLLMTLAAIVIANAVAFWPGRAAARLSPAEVLRAE